MRSLQIVTACFYPDESPAVPLLMSAKKEKIEVSMYGIGEPWPGYAEAKIARLRKALDGVRATYTLFVDGADSLIMRPKDCIFRAYDAIVAKGRTRIVVSGNLNCHPFEKPHGRYFKRKYGPVLFKYPCAGVFMGPTGELQDALEKLDQLRHTTQIRKKFQDNDQAWWIMGIATGVIRAEIDTQANLVVSLNRYKDYWFRRCGVRIVMTTGTKPCVAHFNGNRPKKELFPLIASKLLGVFPKRGQRIALKARARASERLKD